LGPLRAGRRVPTSTFQFRSQFDGGSEKFEINVKGGNNGSNLTCKDATMQDWDMIFLYHIQTELKALVPKNKIQVKHSITFGKSLKYDEFVIR
jgi:hypothetical protein